MLLSSTWSVPKLRTEQPLVSAPHTSGRYTHSYNPWSQVKCMDISCGIEKQGHMSRKSGRNTSLSEQLTNHVRLKYLNFFDKLMKIKPRQGEKKWESSFRSTLYAIHCANNNTIRSVQFSHSVVFDSLRPHESQHARPPSPSPTSGVHSNSCPSSQWCHPAISYSVIPFSSCPQSLPASGSFPMSQIFSSGGQGLEFHL